MLLWASLNLQPSAAAVVVPAQPSGGGGGIARRRVRKRPVHELVPPVALPMLVRLQQLEVTIEVCPISVHIAAPVPVLTAEQVLRDGMAPRAAMAKRVGMVGRVGMVQRIPMGGWK